MTRDEISEALRTLVDLQRQTECMFSAARALLQRAANEQAEAMRRAEVVNFKVYTEAEAAAEMKVGESTLRAHRTRHGADWPRMRVGSRILYTNSHLVEIAALLDARPEASKRKAAETAARRGRVNEVGLNKDRLNSINHERNFMGEQTDFGRDGLDTASQASAKATADDEASLAQSEGDADDGSDAEGLTADETAATATAKDVEPVTREPKPIEGLAVGRIVHYVFDKPYSAGEAPVVRPAIIVHVWDRFTGCANLQVFTDSKNDGPEYASGLAWKTSRIFSEGSEPGTWRFPPRV